MREPNHKILAKPFQILPRVANHILPRSIQILSQAENSHSIKVTWDCQVQKIEHAIDTVILRSEATTILSSKLALWSPCEVSDHSHVLRPKQDLTNKTHSWIAENIQRTLSAELPLGHFRTLPPEHNSLIIPGLGSCVCYTALSSEAIPNVSSKLPLHVRAYWVQILIQNYTHHRVKSQALTRFCIHMSWQVNVYKLTSMQNNLDRLQSVAPWNSKPHSWPTENCLRNSRMPDGVGHFKSVLRTTFRK